MLKASPVMHSKIPPQSLCQPRPQWSTAAAPHVIRATPNKRPIGLGREGNTKKIQGGGDDDATLGWKTRQQASPMEGPAGRPQPGRGASSGRSRPQLTPMQSAYPVHCIGIVPIVKELMGRIMACTDLSSLDHAITEHGRSFHDRHVSSAMSRVGKLYRRNQVAMAQQMMQNLGVFALRELSNVNAQSLSTVLVALNKVGGPVNPALIQGILSEAKLKLPEFNAQGLSNTLYAAAKLGIEDKAFIAAWLREAKLKLHDFNAQNLSNTLSAAADMGILNEAFIAEWLLEAKLKLHDFNAQNLSNTLSAAADMGIQDEAFIAEWLLEAKLKLHDFNAQNLSNTLSAAADMGIQDEAFIAAWLRVAKLKLHDFNAQGLSQTLRAAANLGIEDKAFIATWLREAKLKLHDFNAQGLSNTLSAAAKLGIEDEAFIATWLREAMLKLHDFNAQNLSNTLWAAANLGIEDKAFTAAWVREAKLKLHDFNAQNLTNTLWAAANLGIEDKAFTAAWVREAKLKLHDFNAQGLTNTLWAAANLSIEDKAFTAAWLREAKLKLHDFNAQGLSNTLWAAANLGIEDEAFAAAWLREAKLKLHDFNAQGLSNSLWAAAKLGIEDEAFIATWISVAKLNLPSFNAQDLSNTLWAAANLGIEDEAFMATWISVAKLKLHDCNPQELFNTLWAAANLGIKDDDFAATWMSVAKQKLPEFDVQTLSNILSTLADCATDAPTVQVVGDASNKALAAYTPNGELRQPINQPFSTEELKAVKGGKWSSTARELAVVKLALEVMEKQRPGYLSGKRFQYGTDCEIAAMMMRMVAFPAAPLVSSFAHGLANNSRGTYADHMATAMGMNGIPGTVPLVKDIRLLCEKLGVELDVVWRRRNHPEQQVPDGQSKVEDKEDWSLHQGVYLKVLEHPCLQGRRPTLDVFASGANTKVQVAHYSNYLGVGCLGVDAFQHPWVRKGTPREEQLAYIHGPFHLLSQVLQRVRMEEVDCIVITPGRIGPWVSLLSGLPVQATMELPRTADLLVAGALVPDRERRKRSKDPLKVIFILWGNMQDAQD
eukprot:gene11649-biopygen15817